LKDFTNAEAFMFHLAPEADISDTALVDSVSLPPAFLVARFGPPSAVDRYKISGRYKFTDDRRHVFTLYDWKSTTLYLGCESDAPTPDDFWAEDEPREFNIGGSGEENDDGLNLPALAFREWLLEQYRGYPSGLAN
jgi:hypothetical protein